MASAEEAEIEEVVSTQSRSEKPLFEQSGNLALVKGEEVEFIGSTHINELAVRVPGVNISRNDGQEYLASIRSPVLSGAGACGAFLMAQDGIALRSAGFCNVNELFEAFTEQAERIEITRGPGSALYGSNALHGIINVITPAANTDEGRVSLEGGSNEFGRLNASKGITGEKHGFRAMVSVTHDGGYRDDSGYDQQKVNLRHYYTGEEWTISSSLSLTNLDQETAGYITGLDVYKDRDISRTNPNPEAFRKAKSLRYWSRFSTAISDDVRWQFTPYVRALDMEFLMHFLPGAPLEENSQTSIGLQNGFYINEDSDLEIIAGADFEYTRGSLKQTQENPTEGSAFLQATIPAGKQYDYDVDSIMAAAFLQGDWAISEKLHLLAGARLEYMRYDYTNNMVSGRVDEDGNECGFGGCRYTRPESRVDDYTAFSPKIGLLYQFDENHNVYLNLSHGFRAPQATELYRLQRAQTVADLGKVSLKSIELGVRGKRNRLSYTVSLYAMEKDNYIFRDSSFFNVDSGKSDHIGADVMVKLDLTDRLSVRGNVSFARHRYTFDLFSEEINLNGKDIDAAPRNFGSMQLNWRPTEKVTTELEWVHMGSYYLDPENLHKYEGHDYLNLRADVQVKETYALFVRVMNLTDVKYAERADYTTFTDERYFPGKPRSYYVGMKVKF
ncbi:TonB-dependent receptor [Emcibacter sp.]|uniref:TonB-dependent receptor n=1 Tax=Emcibacter sp. TaxID=1979954 RepID=UPI002AA8ACF3|nr:TonB-dependent receptor [Emcibacter sp.]